MNVTSPSQYTNFISNNKISSPFITLYGSSKFIQFHRGWYDLNRRPDNFGIYKSVIDNKIENSLLNNQISLIAMTVVRAILSSKNISFSNKPLHFCLSKFSNLCTLALTGQISVALGQHSILLCVFLFFFLFLSDKFK